MNSTDINDSTIIFGHFMTFLTFIKTKLTRNPGDFSKYHYINSAIFCSWPMISCPSYCSPPNGIHGSLPFSLKKRIEKKEREKKKSCS